MDCRIVLFLTAVIFGAAAAGGPSETTTLTAKVGENITLNFSMSELHGDSEIFWTYSPKQVIIINMENGEMKQKTSKRFELDDRTGSLTIRSLTLKDSGLYQGKIISSIRSSHNFNLTVVETDPISTPAGPPQNTTAHGPDGGTRSNHIAAGVLFGLLGFVCIVLFIFGVRQKKIKGNCRGTSEVL